MAFESFLAMLDSSVWMLAAAVIAGVVGCGSNGNDPPSQDTPASAAQPESDVALNITTTAFTEGQPIPKRFTVDGDDVSPPLAFSGVSGAAKELALICDDPDAPTPQPWVHWVIYGISPETAGLPEGVPCSERPETVPGAMQGKTSWPEDNLGYRGPAPPPSHGMHRYFFKLYALDTALALEPGLTKDELLAAMKGHVLAESRIMGTYDR